MKKWMLLLLALSLFSCQDKQADSEQIIFDRIEFVFSLKSIIDKDIWNDFEEKRFDVPLVYYTQTSSYVANPTERFITIFHPELVYQAKELKIYKTQNRLDSIFFHMATRITIDDAYSNSYDYKSPYMKCSSFEQANKVIPDVLCTEQWSTMVIHEYFHGFQFKHKPTLDFLETNDVSIPNDSLEQIYKSNKWFKEKVDKENDFLLKAIRSANNQEIDRLINSFFRIREERRKMTIDKLRFDIEPFEKYRETTEGTARYVEQKLYEKFAGMHLDNKLIKSDTSFHSFDYYKNYRIEKDKWFYLTNKSSYFYATGFNISRLLDKLKIEYKSRLFNEGGLSLEKILKDRKNKGS